MYEYYVLEKNHLDDNCVMISNEIRQDDINELANEGWKVHSVSFDLEGNIRKVLFERLK